MDHSQLARTALLSLAVGLGFYMQAVQPELLAAMCGR